MGDILKLVTKEDRVTYVENYNYKTEFKFSSLFPKVKTNNLMLRVRQIVDNGAVPVIANFHALDVESKIGDRTNYSEITVEKLLIKEKINQTERIAEFLGENASDNEVLDFVYDDMGNMVSRVLTRAELAICQLMSTGQISINENNFVKVVNFNYSATHNISLSGWNDPDHDIISDLNSVIEKASKEGKKITRAVTSSKIIGYMVANKGIKEYFKNSTNLITKERVLAWINDNFGIAFDYNDEVYKESAQSTTTHRFYPENKITFFTGNGTLGESLYGITPEERKELGKATSGLVYVTQWETPDPVATWTKASAVNLPVMKDINNLFIATVTKTTKPTE